MTNGFIDDEFSTMAMTGEPYGDQFGGYEYGTPGISDVSPRSFLDLEQMHPIFKSGYYKGGYPNPNLITTGRPQTEQELEWILNYYEQTGQLPTSQQAGQHRGGEYLPGSTMRSLGWETSEQYMTGQQYGAEYGPLARNVPGGSRVISGAQGAPMFTATPEMMYGSPMYGREGGGGFIGRGQAGPEMFPQAPQGRPSFQQPNLQELLDRELNPLQQYGYRVDDYLDQLEAQELERLQQQYLGDYDDKGNPYTPEQKVAQRGRYDTLAKDVEAQTDMEKQRVLKMAQSGVDWKQLPYAQESQNMWEGLTKWYNRRTPQLMEEFYQQSPDYFQYGGQYYPRPQTPSGGAGVPETQPQVNPSLQFAAYTQSLGLAQPAMMWMQSNYPNFIRMWQASGQDNFIGWLRQYLASGG